MARCPEHTFETTELQAQSFTVAHIFCSPKVGMQMVVRSTVLFLCQEFLIVVFDVTYRAIPVKEICSIDRPKSDTELPLPFDKPSFFSSLSTQEK